MKPSPKAIEAIDAILTAISQGLADKKGIVYPDVLASILDQYVETWK